MSEGNTSFSFHANGKLLLTGEYLVLDGALALALPARYGQTLKVTNNEIEGLHWTSYGKDGKAWFEALFNLPDFAVLSHSDQEIAQRLQDILLKIRLQNPDFLTKEKSLEAQTHLEFPREWGLGTSSTLMYLLAQWAGIDAFQLLAQTMGGSGYDIACAGRSRPLFYQIKNGQPFSQSINFDPDFKEHLYFVYLGKKQNSREGIARYRSRQADKKKCIDKATQLTKAFIKAKDLKTLEQIINEHENLISDLLDLPKAKDLYFPDFWGSIKSLGAWGGDFVLASSHKTHTETKDYFRQKGFNTCLSYNEFSF